ncbi:undecaprenyl-diphosphate phosphatase [Alkalilimnicola sp. S0819]|uniref:undecaprenyl-diphosphate phosphatase n=1 Tax=Alkalilimnicola sp. S0819 TaxID=2613922 RepID=UPI0012629712|nr:undecaprenyl-diphosphate phosphatase [Alkalilimnicola sp. S0819]KAB7624007.1 undecaprenyl-diphosphate phosphatase [Alkalilimnicola sp. S0819]MPQ16615.1 undecaprenyl-diphosphate phosphatase [Alkalilimnicola sp. S0819]
MTLLQIVVLAVVQGITEFLPISSSAHLILTPVFGDWPDQGLGFDLAVHLGTLVAVVAYFRRDLWQLGGDGLASVVQRRHVGESRLAWLLVLGTIPVGLAGLLFADFIEGELRSVTVITVTTILFGLLLGFSDVFGRRARGLASIGLRDALIVGGAQALALIPGTSRSGITMTAGLMIGLDREAAARFSFLLAVPVTVLASAHKLLQLAGSGEPVQWGAFLLGGVLAAITAFLCIHYFLRWLNRFGLLPYVVYRLALGGILIALFW